MSARTKLIFEGDNRTTRAFNEINRSLGNVQQRLRPITRGFSAVGRSVTSAAGALGLVAAGAGFARLGSDVIRFNDEVAKLARALGEPVEQVSALAFAFELAGSNAAGTQRILSRIGAAAGEAGAGNKRLQDTFTSLNISVRDFEDLDLVGKLAALAQGFEALPENQRIFAAQQIVGLRNAGDLLNLLADGTEGLARALRDAQLSGAIITPEQAAAAEGLADTLARVNASTRNLASQGVAGLGAVAGEAAVATQDISELTAQLDAAAEAARSVAIAPDAIPGPPPTIEPTIEIQPPPPEQILDAQSSISQLLTGGFEQGAAGVNQIFQRLLLQLFTELAASQFIRLLRTLLPGLSGDTGLLGGIGSLIGFQRGADRVPGPTGSPSLAVVHGGETIIPSSGAARGAAGGMTINVDARGAGPNVGAIVRQAVEESVALSNRNIIELERRGRFR